MRIILIHSDLWNVTSGRTPKPNSNAGEWMKNNEKALATMVLPVKSTQLNYIKNSKTSNVAWKKLETIHKPKERQES